MNGFESQNGGAIDVIRLNLLGSVGRRAASMFGVRIVPATLILDGAGTIVARQIGVPDPAWLAEHL